MYFYDLEKSGKFSVANRILRRKPDHKLNSDGPENPSRYSSVSIVTALCGGRSGVLKIIFPLFGGEGPRSICYGSTAALRLIVQPCDEDD
jgi:hypothetical protein